jgi:hypothetical protein
MSHGMMHIANFKVIFFKPNLFSNTKEINDLIHSKSKTLHLIDIWNDNIDYHMNDSHHAIPPLQTQLMLNNMTYK